jgi:hypothetical protein
VGGHSDQQTSRAEHQIPNGQMTIWNPLRDGGWLVTPTDLRLVLAPTAGRPPGPYPRLEWWETVRERVSASDLVRCLPTFIRLAEDAPEIVRNFALFWGVLEACEHDELMFAHCHPARREPYGEETHAVYWEPVETWRVYAREARAILRLGADLQLGKLGADEDWACLAAAVRRTHHDPLIEYDWSLVWDHGEPSLAERRECLQDTVTRWLRNADASLQIFWRGRGWDLQLTSRGGLRLPTILALQIAATLTSPRGIWRCDDCGEIIDMLSSPRRRPQTGRQHFCAECGNGNRGSKRLSARKKRAERT